MLLILFFLSPSHYIVLLVCLQNVHFTSCRVQCGTSGKSYFIFTLARFFLRFRWLFFCLLQTQTVLSIYLSIMIFFSLSFLRDASICVDIYVAKCYSLIRFVPVSIESMLNSSDRTRWVHFLLLCQAELLSDSFLYDDFFPYSYEWLLAMSRTLFIVFNTFIWISFNACIWHLLAQSFSE